MHAFHAALPDYVEGAVLHSGCAECEHRGRDLALFLDNADDNRVEALFKRAATAYDQGFYLPEERLVPPVTSLLLIDPLEQPLFRQVQALQRALQRLGALQAANASVALVPDWVVRTRPHVEASA